MAATLTGVVEVLDRLSLFTSESDPVVSLYLDLRPDQHGRHRHDEFFARAFAEQLHTFDPSSSHRRRLEQDRERIETLLRSEIRTSAQSAAIFTCAGDPDLFEHLQLDAPLDGHRLYIDRQPHLFPLARLTDEYAKYGALLVDTHSARLYVFAIGALQRKHVVENEKPTRTPGVDVFSEGEYQRNSETLHLKHMKEVGAAVERMAREEQISQIFVAAGPVAMPLLRSALSKEAQEKLIEVSALDMNAPDAAVLRTTLAAFKERNLESDRGDVDRVLDAFRSRGLGTIGLSRVRAALALGQVDRLLVPAVPATVSADEVSAGVAATADRMQQSPLREETIEELVVAARRTDADITFIEQASLLAPAGGVAAFLRYRLTDPEAGRE